MPERFGRYWLHEKLGQGGMAEVYRATMGPDPETYAFDLAIKRLRRELANDPEQLEMFFTEAEVARYLYHPNVLQVFESGHHDGMPYIAMEYIWGYDLASLLARLRRRRMRLTTDLAVYIGLQVLRALDYVHQAVDPHGNPMEIVHRDVTPSNIYITFNGDVKLGDFGVACLRAQDLRDDTGVLRGKLAYMPPEVLAGAVVDHTADLWSLAATLYEIIGGRHFYEGADEADLIGGNVRPKIIPLHKQHANVDPALSSVISRALSRRRRKRPEDATRFYRQLKLYLVGEGIQVEPGALGRFVRMAAGNDSARHPVEPQSTAAAETDFTPPGFQSPVEFSPTQRYELMQRRRMLRGGPVAVGAAVALAVVLGVWLGRPPAGAPAPAVAPPAASPTGAPGVHASPSPAAAVPPAASSSQPAPPAVGAPAAADAAPQAPPNAPAAVNEQSWGDGVDLGAEAIVDAGGRPPRGAEGFKALLQRGRSLTARRRFEAAAEAFRLAVGQKPRSVPAQLGWARALFELGQYDQGEQLAQRVVSQASDNARAWFLLGNLRRGKGDTAAAREAYERCAAVDRGGRFGKAARQALAAL